MTLESSNDREVMKEARNENTKNQSTNNRNGTYPIGIPFTEFLSALNIYMLPHKRGIIYFLIFSYWKSSSGLFLLDRLGLRNTPISSTPCSFLPNHSIRNRLSPYPRFPYQGMPNRFIIIRPENPGKVRSV